MNTCSGLESLIKDLCVLNVKILRRWRQYIPSNLWYFSKTNNIRIENCAVIISLRWHANIFINCFDLNIFTMSINIPCTFIPGFQAKIVIANNWPAVFLLGASLFFDVPIFQYSVRMFQVNWRRFSVKINIRFSRTNEKT